MSTSSFDLELVMVLECEMASLGEGLSVARIKLEREGWLSDWEKLDEGGSLEDNELEPDGVFDSLIELERVCVIEELWIQIWLEIEFW